MIEWVLGYWGNKWIALGIYWIPMATCAVGYIIRTARDIQKDRVTRAEYPTIYIPTITIGTLIGRGIVSIIPIANFCAALFDVFPGIIKGFFRILGDIFDQPLVPKHAVPVNQAKT